MDDVFDDECEQTVSIQEYLKGVEDQELEADLVLGGDEGNECTYDKGYMKRQAIFSCLTCTPNGNAGVCTACSLSCHDGHEIIELWTKRNFRCDCGNSKFGEFFCKIAQNKDTQNDDNSYNHNFKGLYCSCGRPYPDPDAEEQVEMMQCCFCEDWFHEKHLGLESPDEIPRDEDGEPLYEDFICQACSRVCSFLTLYSQDIWAVGNPQDATTTDNAMNKHVEDPPSYESSKTLDSTTSNEVGSSHEIPRSTSIRACILNVDLANALRALDTNKSLFLSKSWRDMLCKCEQCVAFYAEKSISFLLDKEDSIVEYEKMAKQKRDENLQQQEGIESDFLNKLGHVAKIEILTGIADMKNEMQAFLESHDSSKTITPADVQHVFENLAKKRRR